jgi:hypothetical protein
MGLHRPRVIEEREVYGGREKRDYQNDRDDNPVHSEGVTFHRPVVGRVIAPNYGEHRRIRMTRIRRWGIREYGCIVVSGQNRSTVESWDRDRDWDCAPGTSIHCVKECVV